ncbi:MAG: hypothetical protein Q8Q31_04470 [Nanoarchaeota archaeon]|nr:hypothetical protein [Nanoarchaeota archaeon]
MAKKPKSTNKKGLKNNLAGINIPESLEILLEEEKTNAPKKNNSKPSAQILIKKEEKSQDILKKIDEAALEDKIKVGESKTVDPILLEVEEEPPISAEEETPLIRPAPGTPSATRRLKTYEENPDTQIQVAAQEEARQRRYQERMQRTITPVAPSPPVTPIPQERQVAYSTRAMYGQIEQKRERVYSIEERSFQMANIIADKSPQPQIKQTGPFENRAIKQKSDFHEEYSLDLAAQEPPKPKRRYPWEF